MSEYQWIEKINNLQISQSTRGKFYTAQGISYPINENNRIIPWLKKVHSNGNESRNFKILMFHRINKIL
jgi:hypothetical protein